MAAEISTLAIVPMMGTYGPFSGSEMAPLPEGTMLALTIAALTMSIPQRLQSPVQYVFNKAQPDGSRYIKAKFEGDTFLIHASRDRIVVDRREKIGRRNTGPDQRDRMRRLAQTLTGCELQHEFFDAWKFALEADLTCPASGNQVLA